MNFYIATSLAVWYATIQVRSVNGHLKLPLIKEDKGYV